MKKIIELFPFIIALIIIVCLIVMCISGRFDKKAEVETITSSTLIDVVKDAKLVTAKMIQNGIAKVYIEGKGEGYVLYYALVKPNVDFKKIEFDIDEETKTVKAILPKEFNIDVEMIEDNEHVFRYYPNQKIFTGKDISYICKEDALKKAQENKELTRVARESLENTVELLLQPILSTNGYTLELE